MKILQFILFILEISIPIISVFLYVVYTKGRDKKAEENELLEIRKKREYITSKNKYLKKKSDNLKLYLCQYGVEYMFGIVTPLQYYLVKFIAAVLTFIFIKELIGITNILFLPLGWFVPNLVIKASNDSDNRAIAADVKNLYDTLKIQTRAGVYLITALEECYLVVKNKRLKSALLQLRKEIILKNDIESAVDMLTIKFKNEYIDSFAMIIAQSLRTGQSVKLLDDIGKQMSDLEHSIQLRNNHKIETRFLICTMLLFVVVIFICMYGVVSELTTSISTF